MDIKKYLTEVLSEYSIDRIYTRAGIELQRLKNDGIIGRGECRYSRNIEGYRHGVEIIYQIHGEGSRTTLEVEVNADEA